MSPPCPPPVLHPRPTVLAPPLRTPRFKSYSKFPPCYKDVAFWVSDAFTENNLCEVVRGIAGDLAEEVKLIDAFTHPKTVSGCPGAGHKGRGGRAQDGQDVLYVAGRMKSMRGEVMLRGQLPVPVAVAPHDGHPCPCPSLPPPIARCLLQGRTSNCYRIAYRSMDRSLTDEEINSLQDAVRRCAR